MNTSMVQGSRVLVRWAGVLRASPCQLHLARELPLFQNVGRVDRIDDRHGEHCVVVVFRAIPCPPFGEPWVDAFTPEELLPIV